MGLLEYGMPYTIRSSAFAAYIRNMADFRQTVLHAIAENRSWNRFRIPLLLTLAAIVILIVFAGGRNITESIQAILGLLGAAVALLFRFLPFGRV